MAAVENVHRAENAPPAKSVPPALRRAAEAEPEDQVSRAVRGLLNRLAESNIQSVVK